MANAWKPTSFYELPFGLRLRVVHHETLRQLLYRDSGRFAFRRYDREAGGGWLIRVLHVAIYSRPACE